MTLIRNFRSLATVGKTEAEIADDSSSVYFDLDNVNTGGASNETIRVTLDEVVLILNALGIGGGGGSNASTTVAGIVEEATTSEVNAATDTGGTGARLFVTPSQLESLIPFEKMQFETSVIESKETAFRGNTRFLALNYDLAEIDSITLETRTAAGTTYTTRADISALNTFSEVVGSGVMFYLKITVTFDASYNGRANVLIKSKPLI